MTEDYKKNLLDYITGNLEETAPTTQEIFKEQIEVNRSKWTGYMPSNWANMRIEGFIKPNEGTSDLGIMYGGYSYNGNSYGFIILVDTNMNPVKYITKFSSGTNLRYIQCMIQGDDGYFYAIDDSEFSYQNENIYNTQKRFLMLNNFSVSIDGNYRVVLRTSYILNGTDYQNFYCNNIYKEPSLSHFVFTGKYAYNSTSTASRIKAIELKVNVGMPNEWNYWKVDSLMFPYTDFVSFDSQNRVKIQFVACAFGIYKLYLEKKDYAQNSFNETELYTFPYRIGVSELLYQGLYLDENNVYFVQDNQDVGVSENVDRHLGLFHYNFTTNTLETIYDHYLATTSSTTTKYERMQITKNEGKLYIAFYNNFNSSKADYHIQRYEGTWNPILVGEQKNYSQYQRGFYVGNKFNLLQLVLYPTNFRNPTWYFFIAKEIYNQNQYNGEPYVSVDSFCPLLSNLYSNGSLMFSRNLYNVSKQNNMTMSSVEIPNTYLNDTTITQSDLLSETNLQMNSNTQNWAKNIYEVVDLNFLNTISVINEDTGDSYLESAVKINNAITDGGDTNYQNTPCNKYRINYTDATTSVKPIYWTSIDDLHRQTMISFYVDKAISSIDFLSNDETTIYLNLPIEVEVGKYYSINQKVKIGE